MTTKRKVPKAPASSKAKRSLRGLAQRALMHENLVAAEQRGRALIGWLRSGWRAQELGKLTPEQTRALAVRTSTAHREFSRKRRDYEDSTRVPVPHVPEFLDGYPEIEIDESDHPVVNVSVSEREADVEVAATLAALAESVEATLRSPGLTPGHRVRLRSRVEQALSVLQGREDRPDPGSRLVEGRGSGDGSELSPIEGERGRARPPSWEES